MELGTRFAQGRQACDKSFVRPKERVHQMDLDLPRQEAAREVEDMAACSAQRRLQDQQHLHLLDAISHGGSARACPHTTQGWSHQESDDPQHYGKNLQLESHSSAEVFVCDDTVRESP